MIRNCIKFDFKYIPSHIEKVIYFSVELLGLSFFPQVLDFLFFVIYFSNFFVNFLCFFSHFMCLLVYKNKNNYNQNI